jgi:hypothetical protein
LTKWITHNLNYTKCSWYFLPNFLISVYCAMIIKVVRSLVGTVVGLKVPKCEIFDRSDFPDFYTIKSSWVGDLVIKILAYYLNFSGS